MRIKQILIGHIKTSFYKYTQNFILFNTMSADGAFIRHGDLVTSAMTHICVINENLIFAQKIGIT